MSGAVGATLIVAAAATACGSASTDRLVMADFSFTPQIIRLPADAEGVTLLLDNVASQPHDFTVEGLPDDAPVHLLLFEGSGDVPYVLPPLPAGEYDVYCSLPGHREAGMTATLIVS